MTMKLRVPTVEFAPRGGAAAYARRPASVAGLRVGFLDGWGDQTETGTRMYPALAEIERRLSAEWNIGDIVWQLKPSVSKEVPLDMLHEFAGRVDLVVNGEGL